MALQTQNRDRSGPTQSSGRQQARASAWAPNERERLTGVCGVPLKFIRRTSGGAALLPA